MYDLVIRNGTIVDGSGMPRYRADLAIAGERIAAIGRVPERGRREIDAAGQVVTPGFIDGHTHMDAQVFWDPLGSCSCWHGVTSVVMGNCGFTLGPGRESQRAMVLSNLEKAEDISAAAMDAAIRWEWTHFRELLDVVERLPKAINYASNIGHSAMRVFAMGERAFGQKATADDISAMERELRDALGAGAVGFTTSLADAHVRPDGSPVASRHADWEEVRHLVCAMGSTGHGVFELAATPGSTHSTDPAVRKVHNARLRDLAVESGAPITFGVIPRRSAEPTTDLLRLLDETAAAGGRMFGQTHTRGVSHLLSFRGKLQFDTIPEWQGVRSLPVEEQLAQLRQPEVRRRLVEAAKIGAYGNAGGQPRKPDYHNMFVVKSAVRPNPPVAQLAAQRGVDPVEVMMDCALETGFEQFFMQFGAAARDEAELLATLLHPRTVMTFSDSVAHVGLIMDSSIQTHLLSYWVRERQAISLEQGVRMITLAPAMAWNLVDRGMLRPGCIADINVFDAERIAPELPTIVHDLPGGDRRLKQKSTGIKATLIGGQVTFEDGEHTGRLGGRLLRSSPAGVR